MKSIFPALVFYFLTFGAYSQWYQHTSIPTKNDLYKITFTDSMNGWIIGNDGTILHTANGGATWEQQVSNTIKHLYGVSMADSLHGWIVGNLGIVPHGIILRTGDGGSNWETLDTPDFWIHDVCFTDLSHGWAVGSNTTTGGPGIVKITQDGGNSWTDIQLPGLMFPKVVVFVDEQTGFIGGDHHEGDQFRLKVFKTTDGGLTWNTFVDWGVDGDMFFYDMMFLDPVTGWISGAYYAIEIGGGTNDNGFIAKIENGSTSWSDIIYEEWWKPRAICFTSTDSGWAVGMDGLFLDTQDNGANWTVQFLPPGQIMNDIFFLDNNHGWAVGNTGAVMYTENNGYTGTDDFSLNGMKYPELEIFPNPASSVTEFSYSLPEKASVQLSVYDLNGREVISLVKGHQDKGVHKVRADLSSLAPGVYYYLLQAGRYSGSEKMVVVR